MKLRHAALSFLAAITMAGCGNSSEPSQPQVKVPRGIFISASDCADAGKLTLDECGQAIDMAVALHEKQAPFYTSLQKCVAAEGSDFCDKTVDGYRARLQAFLVTLNPKRPTAAPLYPSKPGSPGFRSAAKEAVDATDESLNVSVAALTVANENGKNGKKR